MVNGENAQLEALDSSRPRVTAAPAPRTEPSSSVTTIDVREIHLTDYLRVLYKRRWVALVTLFAVVLAAIVYSFTATPVYEARARLLIDAENPNVVSFKEVIEQDRARADYYQTQYNLLQSRSLARRTLDTSALWDRLAPPPVADDRFGPSALLAKLPWAPPPPPPPDETGIQADSIDRLLTNLTVAPVRNSRIVDLRYRSPDAELAVAVANAHARAYIEQNLEFRFLSSKEATDWLGERLAEQRRAVESAEAALQQYREQNETVPLGDHENITVQKLSDLSAAVTRAKTERIEKEALYNQLRSVRADRAALDTFPAILSNAFIQDLKTQLAEQQRQYAALSGRLGDRHPDLIKIRGSIESTEAKLQGEIEKVVQSVQNQYQAALAQERSLTGALEAQKQEALSMNRKAIEYGVLRREVESSRQIYDSLLQRTKETGISSELRTSNVRIVDLAERPNAPVSPRRGLNLLLALLGGTLLSACLAFFMEYVDNRIKSPEELKLHLGLPTLGLIPKIPARVVRDHAPLVSNGVPPNFAEALRTLRTNVLFSSAAEGGKALVVTSTGPSEGKTLVASNLAIGFAQTGQRVLLIDADMRRPRIHEVFEAATEPGLSHVLVGGAKVSEAIVPTNVPNLYLLVAGRTPPNPPELLGSQRFQNLILSLRDHFDWVVVDTPPILAVCDAALVARDATGVIYVVGAEMTSRYAAASGLEQLERARAPLIGAVLNRAELDRHSYYYSPYYRPGYSNYYVGAPALSTD